MRLGRTFLLVALIGILAIVATSVASSHNQAKIRVGYSSDALAQPAQAEAHFGAMDAAKRLGVELIEHHAPDAAGQAAGIENLLTKGVDVLAIDPNDSKAIGPLVKEANKKGVPVVMFIGANLGGGEVVSFLTSDEKKGGYRISLAMFKKLGGKGNVAFIQGCKCHQAGALREAGFRQAMKQFPGIKLVAYGSTDWDEAKANTLATNMLSRNRDINAFIALTDPLANGAIRAAKAAGSGAIVSGYNGVCSALQRIWSGEQAATLDQNWRGIGDKVVETAVAVAKGQKVPGVITMPSYVIDKAAMQQILAGKYPGETDSLRKAVSSAIKGCK